MTFNTDLKIFSVVLSFIWPKWYNQSYLYAQRMEEVSSICQESLSKTVVMGILRWFPQICRFLHCQRKGFCIPAEIFFFNEASSTRAGSTILNSASSTIHTIHTNQNFCHSPPGQKIQYHFTRCLIGRSDTRQEISKYSFQALFFLF